MIPRRALTRQRWVAWLTGVVLVLAALAPTVSRALAGNERDNWQEICSAAGTLWVQVDAEDTASTESLDTDGTPSLNECPLCVLMADRLAPPGPAVGPVPAPASGQLAAAAKEDANVVSSPEPTWTSPRGPPPLAIGSSLA